MTQASVKGDHVYVQCRWLKLNVYVDDGQPEILAQNQLIE